jgi:amino acid adenylation domain-containing protein/non-ribosomal peptide synthase protein (TIGR01720 family)
MKLTEFINLIEDSNVSLSLDKNDNIKVSAPKGVLKKEHFDALKRFKPDLIHHLSSKQVIESDEITSSISQEKRKMGYKVLCSTMQKGMWLNNRLQSDSSVYNMSGAFEIFGKLQIPLLELAFQHLISEHDVLRTRFMEKNGEIWQCIEPKTHFTVNAIEIASVELKERIQQEAKHVFDLEQPGLLRATVYSIADNHQVLVLTLHHIIADGWSLQLLVKHLNTFYTALLNQSAIVSSPFHLQYADFTQWQMNQLNLGRYQHQLDYWVDTLADQAPLLSIPTDRPRPAKQDFNGDSVPITLPKQLKAQLEALCKKQGATMFMLLLAGFKVFLARYCHVTDLSIGTPVANRSRQEIENVLGIFVNTVVVRSEVDSCTSFSKFFNSVKETSLNAYANSQVPFEQVVSEINPERSASFHPLCQVLFSFQNQAETQVQLGDLNCHRIPHHSQTSRVDMTLMLNATAKEITGHFEYATALFDRSTIEHLTESYIAFLGDLAENPDKKLHEYTLLSNRQHNLLTDWQGSKTQYPNRIDWLVSSFATKQPNAIATSCNGQHMTYAELENFSNNLAEEIIKHGVKKGELVGVLLRPCLELPGVLLALLKADCSYVPLDPRYPDNRLNLMINDSGISTLIGSTEFKERISSDITFHDVKALILHSSHSVTHHQSSQSNLLCVKYTSGSTGIPKGVRLTHQNILRLVINSDLIKLNQDTIMLQYASLSFDASALEIWGTLANGGHLIIADPEFISPADLSDFLRQQPINTAFFTTSLFNELFTHHADVLSKLNLIMAGGEAFNPEYAQKVIKLLPNVQTINGYGPTENGIFSCCHLLNSEEDYRHTVPIGKCVNNSNVYVLDDQQQLLPSGAVGELWVGGDGLAEGYHEKTQLTSDRFVSHKQLNQRLYRTGDVARMRHDGQLIYLGRTDNQIKLRGYRIEIEEIETQLLALPGITNTAVFCEGEGAAKHLLAYVRIESDLSINDIQFLLHKVLPAYMIPTEFRLIDVVPYTNSGKFDRAALKEIELQPQVEETIDVSELQKVVINIWKETLNVNHVNLNSNFFHEGGNSLTAIRLLAKVRIRFDISIPAAEFLTSPTPAYLSRLIEQNTYSEKLEKITPRALNTMPVLSLGQTRLWLMQEISQGEAIHNMSAGIHFLGPLNVNAITESLSEMLESHRVFRSRIISEDGLPVLSYHHMDWEMKTQRYSLDPEVNKYKVLTGLVNDAASKDFDLAKDWLLRAKLYRFSEQEHFLVLCVHHIISDGWSVGLMLSELGRRYSQKFAQMPEKIIDQDIAEKTIISDKLQYDDFACWQQNLIDSPIYKEQIDYWCQTLKDIPPAVSLPFKSVSQNQQQFQGKDCSIHLSNELCDSVNNFAKTNSISVFSILFTVFHALIARLSNRDDLTIGIPSAGRNHHETENMLGFFVNTLAIRYQWDLAESFETGVVKMASSITGALSNQDAPYDSVVNAVKPTHGRGDNGLFNVFFNMLNLPSSEFKLPHLKQQIIQADDSASKFDLTLYLKEGDEGLSIRARFNAINYKYSQIQELLTQYKFALQQALLTPEASINSWSLFTETAQSLIQANASTPPKQSHKGVIEYFEHQVAVNPELTAISDKNGTYSYKELSEQANKLANGLISQGCKQGHVIAIYADRNVELIIAMLAILKIKGVFVVLDSSYPIGTLQARITAVDPVCIIKCKTDIPKAFSDYLNDENLNLIDPSEFNNEMQTIDLSCFTVNPSDTAYLAFTSGTTGDSRVVIGTHRGLERAYLNWSEEKLAFKKGSKFSMLSGLGHDPLHRDIFLALSTGGTICIPGPEDIEPIKLGQWFRNNAIEYANLTPAMLSLVVLDKIHIFDKLKMVMCVGEALPWSLVQELKSVSNADLYNLYGTTETQQCLARFHCPNDSQTNEGFVPIGFGLSGTQVIPLRANGKPTGIGEVGEIVVIGDGIANGYLHSNDKAFFLAESGIKGYRTGDMGMLLDDGFIRILGRSDRQMVIRGFRVEPAEIEQTLISLQGIDSAYVCKRKSLQGQELLLAYIKSDKSHQEQNLMNDLQQRLPSYMLPNSIIQLAEFPRSPNGKIDVSALPLPNTQSLLQELDDDPITNIIAETWAKVLEIERPINDVDFFQIGGHSLLAARVIAHLQSELQVTVSLKEFFRATQISSLSQLIRIKQNEQKATCPIVPVDRSEFIPLSLQQNRLWVLNELNFNKNIYNISGAYRLHGDLNLNALETAFKQLLKRHEILRTSFREQDGQPFQHIADDVNFSITQQPVMEQDINTLVKQEAQNEFNIEKAPLVRAKLLTLASDEHILLITFHHLVFDGGSWGVFINEITQNYNAGLNKTTHVLTTLPVQFADYAHWQRKELNSEHLSKQSDYWQQHLKNLPPLLHLPTKQPRPARQRFQGDLIPLDIDNGRLKQLLQFSQNQGVTLHMTLLTIFQVLLAKLSGQDDIAVGTPVANRSHVELENLIGFFVNTLVIRNRIQPNENFLVTLQNLKETTLAAYENQDIPFEQIVEALQPERSLSNSPLFQVLFSLQNAPASSGKLKDINIKSERYQSHSSRFDLVLNLQQSDNGLQGYLEYDTDLFEKTTISRWLNHYIMLIDSILIEANRPIHAIPMLTSQDKTQLHQFSSGPIKTIETHTGIHGLIKAQFLKHPNTVAIRQGQKSITYAELNDKAEQIARWLQNRGLKLGDRVAVNLNREIDFFIVMLAILKAGGCYVPIDPTYPHNRQKLIAEDADLFLLISESAQPIENVDCLSLKDVLKQSTTALDLPELTHCDDYIDLPAYMIYTSGSTGRPKGVSVKHGGLCNMIVDQIDEYGISKNDRVLQFASLSFDVSIKEIFLAFASGASLVLPEAQKGYSLLESLQSELCRHKVTTAILLPTVLPHLNADELPDLRLVYTGAEVVPAQIAKLWSKGRRFVNAYGPTECTVMATAYECSTELLYDPPIGRPIANSHVLVLSEHEEWCGIGIAGEICILGSGVAGSYWRQNESNNSRFTKFSFNGELQPMYRTGDIGRWQEDGNLEFIGRKDNQIKIRGFRIEIDEIVATLQQCKHVSEVVVVVDKESEHTRLLAYYVGKTSVESLREHAKSILPKHMIPSAIMRLEAIPHTANRKVDYTRLPAIEDSEPKGHLTKPRNEIEEVLISCWSKALGVNQLSLFDNFFEMGGDSILALQAVSLCRQEGVEITAQQIFEYQNVSEITTVCQLSTTKTELNQSVTGPVLLAPIQQWFFGEVRQHTSWFNQGVILRLKKNLSANELINAFNKIVQHHDILRAQYMQVDNQWQQTIPPSSDDNFTFIEKDLSLEFQQLGSGCIADFCSQLQAEFKLKNGRLLTAALVHLKPGESRLIVFAHHLIVDGVSWRIILEDLQLLCLGKPLLSNTDSYQAYSNQCHALLADPEWTKQRPYWLNQLQKKCKMSVDKSGSNTVGSSQNISIELSEQETHTLLQSATMPFKLSVTDVLLAALLQTLQHWNGNDAISINMESHGRNAFQEQVNLTRTVGWCTSLYPLLFDLSNLTTDEQFLHYVKDTTGSVPNQGLGFGLLEFSSETPVTHELGKMPEIGFNYLGQFDQTFQGSVFEPAPESTGNLSHKEQIRTQKLSVNALVKNNRMKINWIYSQNLHFETTIENLVSQFKQHLLRLMQACQSSEIGLRAEDFVDTNLNQDELEDLFDNLDY